MLTASEAIVASVVLGQMSQKPAGWLLDLVISDAVLLVVQASSNEQKIRV